MEQFLVQPLHRLVIHLRPVPTLHLWEQTFHIRISYPMQCLFQILLILYLLRQSRRQVFAHLYHLAQHPHLLPILFTASLVIHIQQPSQHHNGDTKHPQQEVQRVLFLLQMPFLLHHTQILTGGIQNIKVNVMVVVRFCLQTHCTKDHAQLLPHHRHPFRHSHHIRIHNPAHLCRYRVFRIGGINIQSLLISTFS